MWDFQKLEVYQKSKNFCKEITATLSEKASTGLPTTNSEEHLSALC